MASGADLSMFDGIVGARYDQSPNVTGAERLASIGGGAALALWAARRGGATGLAVGAIGLALVARGAARRDPIKRAFSANPLERRVARVRGWSTAGIASRAVTMNCPASEVYALWRDLANLPRWMEGIEKIEVLDEKRSRWTVRGATAPLTFESIITEDEPDRRIAWETAPGGAIQTAGWVEFEDWPNKRGCVVRAHLAYEPPGGQLGRVAAKLMRRAPEVQLRKDLRRLKQMVETGEISTSAQRAAPTERAA